MDVVGIKVGTACYSTSLLSQAHSFPISLSAITYGIRCQQFDEPPDANSKHQSAGNVLEIFFPTSVFFQIRAGKCFAPHLRRRIRFKA
eukprot:754595-Hanusia_phi.AAC.3